MRKTRTSNTVRRFNNLDLYDDNLKSIRIHSLGRNATSTTVTFELEDDSTGTSKLLNFHGCANIRLRADFDVLSSNWFAQTHGLGCTANVKKMKKFVRSQMVHWHTTYMPPLRKDHPIRKKLSSINDYALFKLTFFGGCVELLAKGFSIRQGA